VGGENDDIHIRMEQANVGGKRIGAVLVVHALQNVALALEDGKMSILRQVVDACGIKVCLDVGHANIDAEHPNLAPDNSPMDSLDEFRTEIVHFHLADNDSVSDQHLLPGNGVIDWSPILTRLEELSSPGQCVLELNTDDARQAAHQARVYLGSKLEIMNR